MDPIIIKSHKCRITDGSWTYSSKNAFNIVQSLRLINFRFDNDLYDVDYVAEYHPDITINLILWEGQYEYHYRCVIPVTKAGYVSYDSIHSVMWNRKASPDLSLLSNARRVSNVVLYFTDNDGERIDIKSWSLTFDNQV